MNNEMTTGRSRTFRVKQDSQTNSDQIINEVIANMAINRQQISDAKPPQEQNLSQKPAGMVKETLEKQSGQRNTEAEMLFPKKTKKGQK